MMAHDRFMMVSDAHGRGWFMSRSSQLLPPTHWTARWRPKARPIKTTRTPVVKQRFTI
jgi:hypothetical protein